MLQVDLSLDALSEVFVVTCSYYRALRTCRVFLCVSLGLHIKLTLVERAAQAKVNVKALHFITNLITQIM